MGRNSTVWIDCSIVAFTRDREACLVYHDDSGEEIWVPVDQIKDFSPNGELADADSIELTEVLAYSKGFI